MIKILSPVAKETPSIVSPFAKSEASVPAAVVAALTEFFTSKPFAVASTYDFEAASFVFDGVVATLMFERVVPSVVNLKNDELTS